MTFTVPRLLVLTDRSQLPLGRSLLATLRVCVESGATHVVVRELDEPDAQRAALCAELAAMGATAIAARRPLPGAAAVHLPAGYAPLATAGNAVSKRLSQRHDTWEGTRTPRYKFGRSCHDEDEVRRAAAEGAVYATLSPFAPTESKPGHGPPVPRKLFGRDHGVPLLALGGINVDNAGAAREAGAHGVAVMGAVMRAADPAGLVAALLEAVS